MSTAETGDALIAREAVGQAKALLETERAAELRQLDLLDQPSPEEMLEAREDLGFGASGRAVATEARQRRRGRPEGARNKRTDDFARWLLSFGQHPAKTMMQVQATPTEVLMEASKKSYLECLDRRIRCAEALMPYLESKKPVAVDLSFSNVADLMIEGVTHSRDELGEMIEGEYLDTADELPPTEDAA
jgi:hypothetical protein